MKRSRTALALFLCTFAASLLAVGFADGESHPPSYGHGLQPGDLDQLYLGFSPTCSLGVPRGTTACESSFVCQSIELEPGNACPMTGEVLAAVEIISNGWTVLAPANLTDAIARGIGQAGEFIARHASPPDVLVWEANDANLDHMCENWIAADAATARQSAIDARFLYAVSGQWRTSRQEPIDCIDGCWAVELYLGDGFADLADLAADPRHCRGGVEALSLNESSDGLDVAPASEDDAALRFVAAYFGPAHAMAISRHTLPRVHRYESVWSGCDELPDASIQGWLDELDRAAALQTWRAAMSPIADLAANAVEISQGAVSIVSRQIAGWLIERSENLAAETAPPEPTLAPKRPRNANRSMEGFIIL